MHLTKQQSIILSIGTLVFFFVAAAVSVQRHQTIPIREEPRARLAGEAIPATVEQGFVIDKFQRSEIRDGRKVWEVNGEHGAYDPMKGVAEVNEAELSVFQPGGEVVTVLADRAVLSLSGISLRNADLIGSVKVQRSDGLTAETDRAIYDHEAGILTAPGRVVITNPTLVVEGEKLEFLVKDKVLRLQENVRSTVQPRQREESKS